MDLNLISALKKANEARENSRLEESLSLFDQALILASENRDIELFCEAISGRSISLRHLADKNGDGNLLILAMHELKAAVDAAEDSGIKESLALPHFQLGSVLEKLNKLPEAADAYEKAVTNLEDDPPKAHNRPAVKADFKIHLYAAEHKNGNREAFDKLQEAVGELEKAEEDSYNKNVWISGAYMRMAELLKDEQKAQANEYINKAKGIIDSDPRLSIRLTQWEKLSSEI